MISRPAPMSSPEPPPCFPPQQPQASPGYPDSALKPASPAPCLPRVPAPPPPAHPTHVPPPADQRDRLPGSSSIASMSSSPRGRRAPAPAALDLGAGRGGGKYAGVGLGLGVGHEAEKRRVVTEPVSCALRGRADSPVSAHLQAAAPPPKPPRGSLQHPSLSRLAGVRPLLCPAAQLGPAAPCKHRPSQLGRRRRAFHPAMAWLRFPQPYSKYAT